LPAVAAGALAAAPAAYAAPPVIVITFVYRMNNTLLLQFDEQVAAQKLRHPKPPLRRAVEMSITLQSREK